MYVWMNIKESLPMYVCNKIYRHNLSIRLRWTNQAFSVAFPLQKRGNWSSQYDSKKFNISHITNFMKEKKPNNDTDSFMIAGVIKIHPFWSEWTRKIIRGQADLWHEVFSLDCFFSCHALTLTNAIAITPELVGRVYRLKHSLSIKPSNTQE